MCELMENQKLLVIIGSVCVVLLAVAYIGVNWSSDVTNTPEDFGEDNNGGVMHDPNSIEDAAENSNNGGNSSNSTTIPRPMDNSSGFIQIPGLGN
jgi:hypothetical protein